MRGYHILAALAAGLQAAWSLDLDVDSADSIRSAASTVAHGLMSYYTNNLTTTPSYEVGTFSPPLASYYWWLAGATWGGLIDYWAYTGDTTWVDTVSTALLAQRGDNDDFMPTYYAGSMGNDDQGFWAVAALTAVEYGFPEPPSGTSGDPTWLSLTEAVWNNLASRWDTSTCAGGLRWQVYSANAGYDYKQVIANALFFQISGRLARFTGNATYYDWAEKSWDWLSAIGLLTDEGQVYDGSEDTTNCTVLDEIEWTYNAGAMLYGAANLYNYTSGSSVWSERIDLILSNTKTTFFEALSNASGIMVEQACEPYYTCNLDQFSFKAYLARWMGKTTVLAPFTASTILPLLQTSASGAAAACSGGSDGVTCGQRWYVDGYDDSTGIGQQLSALEVIQALLIDDAPALLDSSNAGVIAETAAATSTTTTTSISTTTSTSTTISISTTSKTSTTISTSTVSSTSTTSYAPTTSSVPTTSIVPTTTSSAPTTDSISTTTIISTTSSSSSLSSSVPTIISSTSEANSTLKVSSSITTSSSSTSSTASAVKASSTAASTTATVVSDPESTKSHKSGVGKRDVSEHRTLVCTVMGVQIVLIALGMSVI